MRSMMGRLSDRNDNALVSRMIEAKKDRRSLALYRSVSVPSSFARPWCSPRPASALRAQYNVWRVAPRVVGAVVVWNVVVGGKQGPGWFWDLVSSLCNLLGSASWAERNGAGEQLWIFTRLVFGSGGYFFSFSSDYSRIQVFSRYRNMLGASKLTLVSQQRDLFFWYCSYFSS